MPSRGDKNIRAYMNGMEIDAELIEEEVVQQEPKATKKTPRNKNPHQLGGNIYSTAKNVMKMVPKEFLRSNSKVPPFAKLLVGMGIGAGMFYMMSQDSKRTRRRTRPTP